MGRKEGGAHPPPLTSALSLTVVAAPCTFSLTVVAALPSPSLALTAASLTAPAASCTACLASSATWRALSVSVSSCAGGGGGGGVCEGPCVCVCSACLAFRCKVGKRSCVRGSDVACASVQAGEGCQQGRRAGVHTSGRWKRECMFVGVVCACAAAAGKEARRSASCATHQPACQCQQASPSYQPAPVVLERAARALGVGAAGSDPTPPPSTRL